MNPKKLRRLRQQLEQLRCGTANMPSRKLERFAKSLGRRRAKRGSEPMWISDLLPQNRPLAIPNHSRPLWKYTADKILDQLEIDLIDLETREERGNGHENDKNR